MLRVENLRTEYLENPIGVDNVKPRLSWKLKSDKQNVMQHNYHIIAAKDLEFKNVVWDSGCIISDNSVRVIYEGEKLNSRDKIYWKVSVEAEDEPASSEIAFFEMGLLNESDWKAKWIEMIPGEEDVEAYKPASYLRRSFNVKSNLKKASIYQTAHGLYEFWINGERGTEDVFKPGFTSYYHRIQYQTYDITKLLSEGENTWAVEVGDGWWRGNTGGMYKNNFGYKLQFIGQIVLEYDDGTTEIIATDEQFKTSQSAIRMCDMKFGEIFNASMVPSNWKMSSFIDNEWSNVQIAEGDYLDYKLLIPSRSVSVREKETFEPKVIIDKEGSIVLDFGQNITGYVRMTLHNTKPGQTISLIHSEDMKDGIFNLGNVCVGMADDDHYQQIDYLAKGSEIETYQPTFAVFGFQYVKLVGYTEPIQNGDFIAVAIYSDMEQTGDFSCSNPLINQLVKNSRWSMKGNFLDVPTDCPTRERSPWTGDSHVFAKTSSEFMNVYPFFEKWLKDVTIEQYRDGMVANSVPATTSLHNPIEVKRLVDEDKCFFIVPGVAGPDGKPGDFDGSAGWGDTATITPYTMYLCYGDKQILENQYDTAKKWVDYMINCAKDVYEPNLDKPEYNTYVDGVRDADYLFDTRFHFGEWLEPYSDESGDPLEQDIEAQKKRTDPLVATAYMFYSSKLVSKMAEILNKEEDSDYYKNYSENVKRVYNKYLIQSDGTIVKGKQAPYVRTLQFDLCNPEMKEKVVSKLIEEVRNNGTRLNTGFLSTPFLLFQLLENGYKEEAFTVLEQTDVPSWLHPILLGATTILEDWTGLDKHMNSYNHYSYGAVCDFLFSAVCGIRPLIETPGYKHFELAPIPGGTLTNAKAIFDSQYGTISSEWKKVDGKTEYYFEVPVNTTAHIVLPNGTTANVGSGSYKFVE